VAALLLAVAASQAATFLLAVASPQVATLLPAAAAPQAVALLLPPDGGAVTPVDVMPPVAAAQVVVLPPVLGSAPQARAAHPHALVIRQMVAGAVNLQNNQPAVIADTEAEQICCGKGPDLNGAVVGLHKLMGRARNMINGAMGGRQHIKSPQSKRLHTQKTCWML
jgi:hypothetical protein